MSKIKIFHALQLSDVVFILLINVKMPTIVGILVFISRINFMLSSVEHETSFMFTRYCLKILILALLWQFRADFGGTLYVNEVNNILSNILLTFFLLSAGVDTEHIVRIWACLIPAVTGLHLLGGTRAWEGQISGFITGGSTGMIISFFGPRLQIKT